MDKCKGVPNYATHTPEEVSDYYLDKHITKVKSFNPHCVIETDINPLTGLQKSFLKYVVGHYINEPERIAGYWTHSYNIDYNYLFSKLINMKYLKVGTIADDLHILSIADLKLILKSHNLALSGKKDELMNRVSDNISPEDINTFFITKSGKYILTTHGKDVLAKHKDSITKDIDFEDSVLCVLRQKDLKQAYAMIADMELKKPIPRGLGMNWAKAKIPTDKLYEYKRLFVNNDPDLVSCYILTDMLGFSKEKADILVERVLGFKKQIIDTSKKPNLYKDIVLEVFTAEFFRVLEEKIGVTHFKYITKNQKKDRWWNVIYKDTQIGSVFFGRKGLSIKILQANKVVDSYGNIKIEYSHPIIIEGNMDTLVNKIDDWIEYMKILEKI